MKNQPCSFILVFTCLAFIVPSFVGQQDVNAQVIESPVMPCGPLFFPMNSPRVEEEHALCLDEIALRLSLDKHAVVVFDGHRAAKEKKGISITRINFDRRYLIERKNIDPSRISTRNFSDTCPHDSNDVALNRRVEIWVIPKGVDANEFQQAKRCNKGSIPTVVTNEKAAPWNWKKRGWTTWGE